LGWDFILASPEGGRQKICWFQAVSKAPNDTAAAVTYAVALTVPARTTERIEILKKLPPDQLGDPHAAVYAALRSPLRRRQPARNRQPLHRHRARRPHFPGEKATARRERHAPAGRGPAVLAQWGVAFTDSFA